MSRITQYDPDVGYYIPIDIGMETDMNRTTGEEVLTDQNEGVSRLAEYEDAEKSGLLIRLPCKVGDTVYFACPGCKISDAKVTGFWVLSEWIQLQLSNGSTFTCWDGPNVYFGKTVFLTREEAERALHHD